jgi:hypothetical protein
VSDDQGLSGRVIPAVVVTEECPCLLSGPAVPRRAASPYRSCWSRAWTRNAVMPRGPIGWHGQPNGPDSTSTGDVSGTGHHRLISFVRSDRGCSPLWTALRAAGPGPVFAANDHARWLRTVNRLRLPARRRQRRDLAVSKAARQPGPAGRASLNDASGAAGPALWF